MLSILVTGASGFLGGQTVDLLRQQGHTIYAVRRGAAGENTASGLSWVTQDLSRPLDRQSLPGQIDVVVHLAQSRHYKDFPARADDIYAINVNATFELLNWAHDVGAKHFIYASTGGVFAPTETDHALSEDDDVRPHSFYARSKYAGEMLTNGYATEMTTTVVRPFFVYGCERRRLIGDLVTRVINGNQVTLAGDRGLSINPIHVHDAARAIGAIVSKRCPGTYNLAGTETTSIRELAIRIGRMVGRDPKLSVEGGASRSPMLVADTSAMRSEFGTEPEVDLQSGLEEIISERRDTT